MPPYRGAGAVAEEIGDGRGRLTEWVAQVIKESDGDITGLRVRLTGLEEEQQAVGQVNLSRAGRAVRVQAVGESPQDAGLLLIERLARQMGLSAGGFRPRPWPDSLAGAAALPEAAPPVVVRRKDVEVEVMTPFAAMAALDARDHQAHLFIDADTGMDAVVYRGGPDGYRLARTGFAAPPKATGGVLVTCPQPAPHLTEQQAIDRLAACENRFLFYTQTDAAIGRGALLYTRYAGGCGLVRATR